MDLFHLQQEAQGSIFWHPNGFTLWRILEAYIRRQLDADGYVEVKTPQLLDSALWVQSGHWGKFRENMFVVPDEIPGTDEDAPVLSGKADLMALKPMNCPGHIQIFKQGTKSYRDLPLRMAEFGCCHRNEAHGALHGLMRVRQMTQDDAHIFCREDQIFDETRRFLDLFARVYGHMGMTEIAYKLATRPDQPRRRRRHLGPRRDGAGRGARRQRPRLRLRLRRGRLLRPEARVPPDRRHRPHLAVRHVPARLRAARAAGRHLRRRGRRPAPAGDAAPGGLRQSFERFIGVLIEHYAGRFPLWLAPRQVVVAPIVSEANDYAEEAVAALRARGLRAEADLRNEKINYKVREHSLAKVPVILAVGQREVQERTVSLRRLGEKDSRVLPLDAAVAELALEATPPDLRG